MKRADVSPLPTADEGRCPKQGRACVLARPHGSLLELVNSLDLVDLVLAPNSHNCSISSAPW